MIFSGTSFVHLQGKACFDDDIFVFDVRCDRWLEERETKQLGFTKDLPGGRIQAAAITREERFAGSESTESTSIRAESIIVIAGFNGLVRDDIVKYQPLLDCTSLPLDRCEEVQGCRSCNCVNTSNANTTSMYPCGCHQADESDLICPTGADSCPEKKACSSYLDCEECASDQRCGFVYQSAGSFKGLHGTCYERRNDTLIMVKEPAQCDFCGRRTSCDSCAGLVDPGRPGMLTRLSCYSSNHAVISAGLLLFV